MKISPLVIYTWVALIAAVAAKAPNNRKDKVAAVVVSDPLATPTPSRGGGSPAPTETSSSQSPSPPPPPPPSTTTSPTSNSPSPSSTSVDTPPPSSAPSTLESSSTPPPSSSPPSSTMHLMNSTAPLSTVLPSFSSSSFSYKTPSSMNLSSTGASMAPTGSPTSSSSSGGGSSTALIVGSVCGFVAILAAGFGYAFFSKVRRNRRKDRVFGDEDDGPMPPPPPFVAGRPVGDDSLSPGWESDYKQRAPSPMLTRPSPPAATRQLQEQEYYNQYGGYEHTGGYEQHAGYEQHVGGYDAYPGPGYPQQGYGGQQPDPHASPYQQHAAYGGYPQQPYR